MFYFKKKIEEIFNYVMKICLVVVVKGSEIRVIVNIEIL